MHQLDYELPERPGFGGLWEAVADSEATLHTAGDVESEPQIVARCDGPTSIRTRLAIESFRERCCDAAA